MNKGLLVNEKLVEIDRERGLHHSSTKRVEVAGIVDSHWTYKLFFNLMHSLELSRGKLLLLS